MKTKRHVLVAIGLFCSLSLYQAVEANPALENEAVGVAGSWLNLVDSGQYAKSWDTAAAYFKAAVRKDQWHSSLTAARKPLGKVLSRELKFKQYATSLPGAPDGEYVVIQYATSFQNKKSAIETVTPMRDKDGTWRVAGYYIK